MSGRGGTEARASLSQTMLRVPALSLQRLRRELLAVLQDSSNAAGAGDDDALQAVFESLAAMTHAASVPKQSMASASANYIVAECHRLVAASGGIPPASRRCARACA